MKGHASVPLQLFWIRDFRISPYSTVVWFILVFWRLVYCLTFVSLVSFVSMLFNMNWSSARFTALAVLMLFVPGCAPRQADVGTVARPPAEYRAFGAPQRVTIRSYNGDAMEPFITKDGQYLLFNNRNDPSTNTNLHFAVRVDGLTFQYRGEIKGVNTPVLEGVPSLDRKGNLFFVSVRSYINTNGLEYAPAVSNDLLELFFTRIPVASGPPQPVPIQE